MRSFRSTLGILRLPLDFSMAFLAFLLAYRLRTFTDLIPGKHFLFPAEFLPDFAGYLRFGLVASAFLVLLLAFDGLYSLRFQRPLGQTALRLLFWVSAWVMFIIAYYALVLHELFFSRIALLHIWLFAALLLLAGRAFLRGLAWLFSRWGLGRVRILLVGATPFALACYQQLKKDHRYHVLGAIAAGEGDSPPEGLPVLGALGDLEELAAQLEAQAILQADSELLKGDSARILAYCRSHQIECYLAPDAFGLEKASLQMEMLDDIPLIRLRQTPLEGWRALLKRLFDFVVALLLVILLSPVWLLIAVLIRLDSRGPIFYRSPRKHGRRIFHAYKFRSMVPNAEALKAQLMQKNERSGPLFKIKQDPRVTRIGAFLRKTSLDELPQLMNVLKGEMSLVGPRPHLPEEVEQYEPHHRQVFAIRPGLTGLAQINGRSSLSFEEEVKLDIYYIQNWSLLLDIKIMLKSALVVFRADGC